MSLAITYGSEYVFYSGGTAYEQTVVMDDTHFVVVYSDTSNASVGRAVVGTVDGTTLSFGTAATFYNSGGANYISACALDATHFAVLFRGSSTSSALMCVGTVSGTSISFGSTYSLGVNCVSTALALVGPGALVAVVSYTSFGAAFYCTVSGTTVTHYTGYTFSSASTSAVSVAALDSSRFVVTYRDVGGGYGRAVVGTLSGTTISYGTVVTFVSDANYTSVVALGSATVVVSYENNTDAGHGTSVVGTVDGTTVTFGTPSVFGTATTSHVSSVVLDATHFVVTAAKGNFSDAPAGTAHVGTVSGTGVSFPGSGVFNPGNTYFTSVSLLTTNVIVVSYQDRDNSQYGTAIVGTVSGFGKMVNSVTMVKWNGTALSKWNGV